MLLVIDVKYMFAPFLHPTIDTIVYVAMLEFNKGCLPLLYGTVQACYCVLCAMCERELWFCWIYTLLDHKCIWYYFLILWLLILKLSITCQFKLIALSIQGLLKC